MGQNIKNSYAAAYLDAILSGDRARCKILVSKYLNENSFVIYLYENVFKPALYEVGKLWEFNKISVAAEHFSTTIAEGILYEFFELNLLEKQFIYGNYNRGNLRSTGFSIYNQNLDSGRIRNGHFGSIPKNMN